MLDTVAITKVDIPASGLINVIGNGTSGEVNLKGVTLTNLSPSNTATNLNVLLLTKVGKVMFDTV
jgi:hypothetical protein